MRILYSFNKAGFEAEYWTREIAAASTGAYTFVPFNHGDYLDPRRCERAQLLDNLYYRRDPALLRLYGVFEEGVARKIPAGADIVLQMHYTTIGQTVTDQTEVGVILAKEPPSKLRVEGGGQIPNTSFVIPPNLLILRFTTSIAASALPRTSTSMLSMFSSSTKG